jgi:hypothetical protein
MLSSLKSPEQVRPNSVGRRTGKIDLPKPNDPDPNELEPRWKSDPAAERAWARFAQAAVMIVLALVGVTIFVHAMAGALAPLTKAVSRISPQ